MLLVLGIIALASQAQSQLWPQIPLMENFAENPLNVRLYNQRKGVEKSS